MEWAVPVLGVAFGLLVIGTTVAISPGVLMAGLMSTDSGSTDAMVPITRRGIHAAPDHTEHFWICENVPC